MSGVRDLRREHFSELPEPSKQPDQVQHEILGDKYMDTLERYIDHLASHVRRIQDEELAVTNQFSMALSSLQTKSHEKRRMREDVAREVYQKKIAKIREKRKRYREMMYDALGERKKLIDSMQIQKDEDDILRRKLAKLSALSASETSREARKTAIGDRFSALFVLLQVALILIYGLAFDFDDDTTRYNGVAPGADGTAQPIAPFYQFYSDMMMMAVIGFGFLMAFLRKYAYSAIGFTLLTVAFSFQWAIAVLNFFVQLPGTAPFTNVVITQIDLVAGMYAVITVLISFGGVLGVVSSVQLLVIAFVEVVLYAVNLHISRHLLELYNGEPWSAFGFGGDAALVHVFGAFFGLALAVPLGMRVRKGKGRDDQSDSYQSDMFAMIGTVFLWVLWPSFNAALAPATVQHRIVVNTVLALAASVVFAFLGSRVFRGGKFDMTDIQSATLAGGVGIGSGAAVVVGPGSALIIGAVCAIVSTLGSAYVGPLLNKAGVIDTRGVLAMHGLPGIIGALSAIVAVAIAFNDETDETVFGDDLNVFFPRGQVEAAYLLLSLVISLAIAVVGGFVVGFLLSLGTKETKRLFSDEKHWRVPGDFEVSAEEGE